MRLIVLKYKRASLYTVVMVPRVCCIQSIKFLILFAVSAFAAKVLQNKSLKSQSFSKKKKKSFILTTVIYSHKYIGQQGLGWAVLLPMAWAGLGWADLGWAWLKVATDDLSPILYPGMAGQPGHVYLMATEEVQDSR